MYDDQAAGAGAEGEGREALRGERIGTRAISLFTRVLNARVLRAHADGSLSSSALEATLGWAPKASLRVAVTTLVDVGALCRADAPSGRQGAITELTPAGSGLLSLADALEHWLSRSPFGTIPLPDTAARGAVRALVAGWDSAIVSTLAERPRTLAELSAEIPSQSYPVLKRRLAKLRAANLVMLVPDGKRSPMHTATTWLRCAVGPLAVAGHWERTHLPDPLPVHAEVETAFLLALPLLELPMEISGTCTLAASARNNGDISLAAVNCAIEYGKVISYAPGTGDTPTAWALGTPDAWLDAIVHCRLGQLHIRGRKPDLAEDVTQSLHRVLFLGR